MLVQTDATDPSPEAFLDALTGIEMESAWNSIIDEWDSASDEEIMSARHFIGTVRDRVVEELRDIADPVEFQSTALLAFIRLKAFWFELNSRLGHHLAMNPLDKSLPLRAGLVAALLGTMEPCLSARAVEKVDAFLSAVVADEVNETPSMSGYLIPGPAEVRGKIGNLLSTIETLSECVVSQEAELIELRLGQESLRKAFGEAVSETEIAARFRKASSSVIGLEAQARMEEIYREVLGQALGTTDPLEVVKEVRALREAIKSFESRHDQMRLENERVSARFGDDLSSDSALDQLRDAERSSAALRVETESLQMRLAAQADSVRKATTQRDHLLSLIGARTLDDAEEAVRTLHENAAAYGDIAELLGSVGKELGKISV